MKVRKTQIPANLNAVEARVIENSDGFIDQLFVEKCVAHRQLLLVLEGLGCTKCEFYRMYNFAKGRNESTHSNFKYLSPTDKIKFLADCTEELVQAASIFPPDLQIFVPVLKAVVNKLIA